jgi:hypothetical protein
MSAPEDTGWASARNTVRVDADKLVIELETFDRGLSDAHQKLAKARALKAATRAIDEVQNMSQAEVETVLLHDFENPSGWHKVTLIDPET